MPKNNHTTAICAGARHRLCCCAPWNCFQPRTPDALLARSSLKHQRKYKNEKGDKYSRPAHRNTVHSSLKRRKTHSLRSSVCDIGIVQITPAAVNGWRATKVCGLSPSSLGDQMDPLLWPKHKVLKYKYNIPVKSWQCDWDFQEGWALTLQCTFSYLGKNTIFLFCNMIYIGYWSICDNQISLCWNNEEKVLLHR